MLADEALVEELAAAVLTRVDAWAAVANTPQGAAGPLAPVLGEYFDMVPLLGRQVAAVSPNGLPLAVGVFAGAGHLGSCDHQDRCRRAGVSARGRTHSRAVARGASAQR